MKLVSLYYILYIFADLVVLFLAEMIYDLLLGAKDLHLKQQVRPTMIGNRLLAFSV